MIVFTNRPEYLNDIAEVIRAYLGFTDIQLAASAQEAPFSVFIQADGIVASYHADQHNIAYPISAPAWPQSPLLRKRQEKRLMKTAVYRVMQALYPEIILPWGALTGIRPTKLLYELIQSEGKSEAQRILTEEFDVKKEKLALALEVIAAQMPIYESLRERDIDIYIGIPFCKTRCLYCSFASEVVGEKGVPQFYLDALYADIQAGAKVVQEGGYRVRAVYIGGGTPTVLDTDALQQLIAHTLDCYQTAIDEFTVEAGRPDTVDAQKLAMLYKMGVGRISLNPQSMNAQTLHRIGRMHTPEQIIEAFHTARHAGFSYINMDVIAGLPGETLADVESTLAQIQTLQPDNLTVHTLAVKRSSQLKERLEDYALPAPGETERMVELGKSCATAMGMHPYYMYRQKYMRGNLENVGYAKCGAECVYNVDMMEDIVSILAHGAGAMTKRVFSGGDTRVERIPAPKDVATYAAKLETLIERKRALLIDT